MKDKIFIRSVYNYDVEVASNEAAIQPGDYGESLTIQSMAEDADINVLMRRYGITGQMPSNPRVPSYGDYSDIHDFRSALEAVSRGEDEFMTFPAEIRSQFDNDPQKFLEFVVDPANVAKCREWGLTKPVVDGSIAPKVDVPPNGEKK